MSKLVTFECNIIKELKCRLRYLLSLVLCQILIHKKNLLLFAYFLLNGKRLGMEEKWKKLKKLSKYKLLLMVILDSLLDHTEICQNPND